MSKEFSNYNVNGSDPFWVCEDCGTMITHSNNQMIFLKDELFLSIAEKHESPCAECLTKRLGRQIVLEDLWINSFGRTSSLNDWYVDMLKIGVNTFFRCYVQKKNVLECAIMRTAKRCEMCIDNKPKVEP